MTRKRKAWASGAGLLAALLAIVVLVAMPQRGSLAQGGAPARGPLVLRGFSDAGTGVAMVTGGYGNRLAELRIANGQQVKKGDVIAILSDYAADDISVRLAEAELEKLRAQRERVAAGIPLAKKPPAGGNSASTPAAGPDGNAAASAPSSPSAPAAKDSSSKPPLVSVAEQEEVVKLTDDQRNLKTLEMKRSGLPPAEQTLNVNIAEQKSAREHAHLDMLKESQANDLAAIDDDIRIKTADLERIRLIREQAVVRSPLDGTVVEIFTRPGELVSRDIAEIADMSKLRVLVDLDERLISRVSVGESVDVVFRGETRIHKGRVGHISPVVGRMKSKATFGTGTTRLEVVEVEITLDSLSDVPQILGREAAVTFL